MEPFIAAGSPVPACASPLIFLHLHTSASYPTSPLLSAIVAAPTLLCVNSGCCKSLSLSRTTPCYCYLHKAIVVARKWDTDTWPMKGIAGPAKPSKTALQPGREKLGQSRPGNGEAAFQGCVVTNLPASFPDPSLMWFALMTTWGLLPAWLGLGACSCPRFCLARWAPALRILYLICGVRAAWLCKPGSDCTCTPAVCTWSC